MKSGLLTGGLPFVRLSEAGPALVVLPGLTDAIWDVAADLAETQRQYHRIAAARILGISLGGYVAQHPAAEFPALVQRLVIASAAYRVSTQAVLEMIEFLQA